MTEYRIEFQIQRKQDGDEDFAEIGFGSSAAWSDIDAAAYAVSSQLQTGRWETEKGHPDPDDVMAAISAAQDGETS